MVLIFKNIFQIYNKFEKIPAPLILYFKICIIIIELIDKLTCTFTTHIYSFYNLVRFYLFR